METNSSLLEGMPNVVMEFTNCFETLLVDIPPATGILESVQITCMKIKHLPNPVRSPWANKVFLEKASDADAKTNGWKLAELRKLNHPNIFCSQAFEGWMAINFLTLEICTISLQDILEERYEKREGPLEAAKTKKMAVQVLRGLDYLHTMVLILHGDMKSANVLVDTHFNHAKIRDFGVSLALKPDGSLDLEWKEDACFAGSEEWSAPESLYQDPEQTCSKSDIFAFGLMLYETLTLMPPHSFPETIPEITDSDSCSDSSESDVDISSDDSMDQEYLMCQCSQLLDSIAMVGIFGSRPLIPSDIPIGTEHLLLIEIFHICTELDPCERPTARQLVDALESVDALVLAEANKQGKNEPCASIN